MALIIEYGKLSAKLLKSRYSLVKTKNHYNFVIKSHPRRFCGRLSGGTRTDLIRVGCYSQTACTIGSGHVKKALLALGFWPYETSQLSVKQETMQRWCSWVWLYSPAFTARAAGVVGRIIRRGVRCSFCLTGQCEGLIRWSEQQSASRFCFSEGSF